MLLERIISGGQTGVDRAALDAALDAGMACGGWCPKERKAEDGLIDPRYPLEEAPSAEYALRTQWNVRDSDGTLILTVGEPTEGTALTVLLSDRMGKPFMVVDLQQPDPIPPVAEWITANRISVLNIAGPRESTLPGIYSQAVEFIRQLLEHLQSADR